MGKKCKKKVQWRQLSLNEIQEPSDDQDGEIEEEEEGHSAPSTPTHESNPRPQHKPAHNYYNNNKHYRRGGHHAGYYDRSYDRRFDKTYERRGSYEKYKNENLRNFENRGPYEKPYGKFYDRNFYYDNNKYYGRPPFYERGFKYGGGFVERGRRPFRPYGRPGFFQRGFHGPSQDGGPPKGVAGQEDEEWEENSTDEQQQQNGSVSGEGDGRPSQPVHTVMINNEEYTKIQTPRQEVIFKKSSLDRKRDSIDQGSVTGSMTSGSGCSSTSGGEQASRPGGPAPDQVDQSSVTGSTDDNSLAGEETADAIPADQVFEDPTDMFVGEPGQPPLAGVVMQQAYPGGPMVTIPVHWTPFIDPVLIPGETALTPLDPAFTHVIDPKALPIDPAHILPVQHDETGCPVQVQVKVDANGVPIQIEPSAFTVSLSSLQQQQQQAHPPHLPQEGEPNESQEEGASELKTNTEEDGDLTADHMSTSSTTTAQQSVQSSSSTYSGEQEPAREEGGVTELQEEEEEEEKIDDNEKEESEDGDDDNDEEEEVEEGDENEEVEEEEEEEEEEEQQQQQEEEEQEEQEQEEEQQEEQECEGSSVRDANEVREEVDEIKDARETPEPQESQQDAYVIPLVVPSTVASEVTHPLSTATTPKNQESRLDDEEEEEEEEEEEDMLAKESEEGSDSSDSQYASMSESSSVPTSPAGEPSDPPETSAPTKPSSSAAHTDDSPSSNAKDEERESKGADSAESNMADSGITESSMADSTTTESSQASTDGTDPSGTQSQSTRIVQGYVMVPILTPYYDPSVIYGYPVVVADQQQQQQQIQQQQQQRNYSKRKKKKYQRRRQAESASGGYLDPHLYTGEPFVATPGGYVVPLDPASVCHVHGLQYVPHSYPAHPPLAHQVHDEGFVSVQHSPYLPESAPPPAGSEQAQAGGSSGDESSKTVFSDLQDTERRQIQEILQDRAKVGKSDSTESSDSGVSESEETAATELSSDELENRQQRTSQDESAAPDQPIQTGEEAASSRLELQSSETSREEVGEETSSDVSQFRESLENETCNNAQLDLSKDTSSEESVPVTGETGIETSSLTESDDSERRSADECDTSCIEEPCTLVPANYEEQSEILRNAHVSEPDTAITNSAGCTQVPDAESADSESVCVSPVLDSEAYAEEKFCGLSNDVDVQSCKNSLNGLNDLSDSSDAQKICEYRKTEPELLEEKDNVTTTERSLKVIAEDSAVGEVYSESITEVSPNEGISEVCAENHEKSVSDFLTEGAEGNRKCQGEVPVSSEPNALCSQNSAQELEIAQDYSVIPGNTKQCETSVCSRTECSANDGGTRESSIDRDSLKDLKVTEAVKRWIREVTPEKAFTLSEEAQSLLLAEQNLDEELDTEDEYIEDEISEESKALIMDPKNVKGNPFGAASSDALKSDMESCSKRVAFGSRSRGATPETLDEYDGASTISNLSFDHLYSEASSSHPASVNHSFDEEELEKYTGNPEIYNPVAYAKYYQLGIEIDETTPVATPLPGSGGISRGVTPAAESHSLAESDCGSEEVETVPHKYDVSQQHTEASPMSLATEILKAEKLLTNMAHITGTPHEAAMAEEQFGNPDIYLKHFRTGLQGEVGDSGVQSEESSDETEAQSNAGSSGVGSSLASTPAISPAHHTGGRPPLQPHPLKNLSAGEGPVPCRTVCCAVM